MRVIEKIFSREVFRPTRRFALAALFAAFAAALTGCGSVPNDPSFSVKTLMVDGSPRHYGLFVPKNYTPQQKWPVIVFLHGIGESGNNGTSNMGVGLGPAVAKQVDSFPFIVVFPQSPGDWGGPARANIAIAALDEVQKTYSTDPDRVILTGLSTGGYGAWAVGANHADRFAALVPMCGYPDFDEVDKLTKLPVWCFHNAADPFVGSGGSREMCKRINAAGGTAKYTQYGAFGHNCWDEAYDKGELWAWMLAQRRHAEGGVAATAGGAAGKTVR